MTKRLKTGGVREKSAKGADIRARCSEDLKRRVVAYADSRERDEGDVLRQALIEFLEAEEKRLGITPPKDITPEAGGVVGSGAAGVQKKRGN